MTHQDALDPAGDEDIDKVINGLVTLNTPKSPFAWNPVDPSLESDTLSA